LSATVLVLASIGMTLVFVRNFDVGAPWQQNRFSLVGTSAILAFVAAFCFQASARLWGRFNFESVLTWVEMVGSWQTSRIGTGNNFTSRMNTENNVVRTEAMTLRVWRARIESVVFGKDEARQVTAMFSTEQEAKALAAQLMQFARSQSVLVAPFSGEDEKRIAALNAGERAMDAGAPHASSAAQLHRDLETAAAHQAVGFSGVASGAGAGSAGGAAAATSGGCWCFVARFPASAGSTTAPRRGRAPRAARGGTAGAARARARHYGPQKAACERVVAAAFGARALIVRPGLIVGPRD